MVTIWEYARVLETPLPLAHHRLTRPSGKKQSIEIKPLNDHWGDQTSLSLTKFRKHQYCRKGVNADHTRVSHAPAFGLSLIHRHGE